MLFNSLQFAIFFPVVTALYFILPHRFRWGLLLGASCLFYMAFIPAYLLILLLTIIVDYIAGILIDKASGAKRKLILVISIVTNVGILVVFKYWNFAASNLTLLAQSLHWNYGIPALQMILPIGLSFHTFQAMSYTIEVYRSQQKPERHFGIYALYVMFYPQLVAGPIERPQNLLHQFYERHTFDYHRVTNGLKLMAWGLFKKVVIADRLAIAVNQVYGEPTNHQGITLIIATIFFAFQIYCDFSGYSDIAIGAAEVMGFKLMTNFNRPYISKSISEFWSRWHISLSTWFRDYVYIPLGGNRVPAPRWYFNLLFTFLLSGLWHGAGWTFIVWGGLNGAYLVCSLATRDVRAKVAQALGLVDRPVLHKLWSVALTFSLICFSWIFFRAASLVDAIEIIKRSAIGLVHLASFQISFAEIRTYVLALGLTKTDLFIVVAAVAILETVHVLQREGDIREVVSRLPQWGRWSVYYGLTLMIIFFGVFSQSAFIYFQF